MNPEAVEQEADLVDLCGRIMLNHRLDPGLAMRALGIEQQEAEAMIAGRPLSLGPDRQARLRLFVNILTRLEWRFQHNSPLVRRALNTPLDQLGGATPADMLAGSMADLRAIRRGIDQMEAPRLRWLSAGH